MILTVARDLDDGNERQVISGPSAITGGLQRVQQTLRQWDADDSSPPGSRKRWLSAVGVSGARSTRRRAERTADFLSDFSASNRGSVRRTLPRIVTLAQDVGGAARCWGTGGVEGGPKAGGVCAEQ